MFISEKDIRSICSTIGLDNANGLIDRENATNFAAATASQIRKNNELFYPLRATINSLSEDGTDSFFLYRMNPSDADFFIFVSSKKGNGLMDELKEFNHMKISGPTDAGNIWTNSIGFFMEEEAFERLSDIGRDREYTISNNIHGNIGALVKKLNNTINNKPIDNSFVPFTAPHTYGEERYHSHLVIPISKNDFFIADEDYLDDLYM